MGIAMTATAVGMIIFGAIYPIIVLILLTRQRVKGACAPPHAMAPPPAMALPPATKDDNLSKP